MKKIGLNLLKNKKINLLILTGLLTAYSYDKVNNSNNLFINKILNTNILNLNKSNLLCYKTKDKEITRVESIIEDKITNLEYKYKGNFRREKVNLGIKGAKYYIEFNINQSNINPDELLNLFLHSAKPNTTKNMIQNNVLMTIIDQSKFTEDDIYSLRIDYEVPSNTVSKAKNKGSLYIRGKFGEVYDNFIVTMEKYNDFTQHEIDALMKVYEEAFRTKSKTNSNINRINKNTNDNFFTNFFGDLSPSGNNSEDLNDKDPRSILKKHGVILFEPNKDVNSKNLEWNYLAGYENQKRLIEDSILLSLTHGEIYDKITQETRVKFEVNRPKAILFEGPPGCGKTTSAKIIANQVNIPLVYMPLEAIMSKWYGESETKFSDIFEACKALGKSIIFIDEIDALATSRDDGIHEATRRILSTLLRKIDGFESNSDVLFICATNRRKDLDPALLSRLDITITFDLPDTRSRGLIFQKYAKQFSKENLEKLAELSNGFSGRDISDVCKDAERRWASKYIRKETSNVVPELEIYESCLLERKRYMDGKKYNV